MTEQNNAPQSIEILKQTLLKMNWTAQHWGSEISAMHGSLPASDPAVDLSALPTGTRSKTIKSVASVIVRKNLLPPISLSGPSPLLRRTQTLTCQPSLQGLRPYRQPNCFVVRCVRLGLIVSSHSGTAIQMVSSHRYSAHAANYIQMLTTCWVSNPIQSLMSYADMNWSFHTLAYSQLNR